MAGVNLLGTDCEVKAYKTKHKLDVYDRFVIGGDIGGTHLRLGVGACSKDNVELAFTFLGHTREIASFGNFLTELLKHLKVKHSFVPEAFALGVASEHVHLETIPLTHAALKISKKEVARVMKLPHERLLFVNDFEVLGHGVNIVEKKYLRVLQKGNEIKRATKAAMGAGTGLGKCVLGFDSHTDYYVPIHSEGGRTDFPAYDDFDVELEKFILSRREVKGPVAFEEVIASRGVANLYNFVSSKRTFKASRYTKEIDDSPDKVPLISLYRNKDKTCKETFRLLSKYYGRCAKNFALDVLSLGGMYLVGGIAHHNPEVVTSKEFIREFRQSNDERYIEILKNIPVIFVDDPLLGLKGACFAAYNLLER